ncbi:uncharacterized protein LOC106708507 isoform X2 [Papilio machaon]|uniref:uncharacterized protein LOC106708507 isoform X2 n=1 Tax=Papilio machaon TaxID=76193 RepID=UPI001E665944|nr:uncharacterized protein LOC106708507 isoform X2 [Papilio machaon]
MVRCCVLGCRNRSERKYENITFHSFRKGDVMRNRWIAFTGRKNWKPSKCDRICSKHFESFCFHKTKFKVNLKTNAVPTLFKYRIANSIQYRYSGYKNNELLLKPTTITQVSSHKKKLTGVKEVRKKISKSSQLGKTGKVETYLHINKSREVVTKFDEDDEETDDALTDWSYKDDDIESTIEPTSSLHTTFIIKDEVLEPEEQFPHNELTFKCDVEDSDLFDTKDSTKNTTNAAFSDALELWHCLNVNMSTTNSLENGEDLENVALVRMEDVQPDRSVEVTITRTEGDESNDNSCSSTEDEESNTGSIVSVKYEEVIDCTENSNHSEQIESNTDPLKLDDEPKTKESDQWPTLEILPGGVIKNADRYEDDLFTCQLEDDNKNDVAMYACAICSESFDELMTLSLHVRDHEQEKKRQNNKLRYLESKKNASKRKIIDITSESKVPKNA